MFAYEKTLPKLYKHYGKLSDNPHNINNIELSTRSLMSVGPKSGAYVIAQYFERLYYIYNFYNPLENAQIEDLFYDVAYADENGYITLQTYMKFLVNALQNSGFNVILNDIMYFTDILLLKHFIHKFSGVIVELKEDMALCNTSNHNMNGVWEINELSNIYLNSKLTKGFIAVGYDDQYVILQNTLGDKYGSGGFIKIKWTLFTQILVKCACIKNIF